jgi:hypothetical protein
MLHNQLNYRHLLIQNGRDVALVASVIPCCGLPKSVNKHMGNSYMIKKEITSLSTLPELYFLRTVSTGTADAAK